MSNDLEKIQIFILLRMFLLMMTLKIWILSSCEHKQVNEDDSDEINIQDCDGDDDKSINEEKYNFD